MKKNFTNSVIAYSSVKTNRISLKRMKQLIYIFMQFGKNYYFIIGFKFSNIFQAKNKSNTKLIIFLIKIKRPQGKK